MNSYQDVENAFGYHKATSESAPLHQEVRKRFIELGTWIVMNVPAGRERALAMTELQNAAMWTNAAVAINLAPLERE